MDEGKIRIALTHCLALAKASQPRVLAVAKYLDELRADHTWTSEERAELQRLVIIGLVEANDEGEVL
jgi:hypothetical protein